MVIKKESDLKRGQVTIFVIVAVIIVSAIIGVVIFMGGKTVSSPAEVNPRQIIQKCVQDAVEESVSNILINGGQIAPSQAIAYRGEEWNYLCYQEDYYLGCYNLHPMLEYMIEGEILEDTKDDVQKCFDVMREDYENRGFDVSGGSSVYSINLLPGQVEINLEKKISVSRDETSQDFENFDTKILSPIYELMRIVREIVNSESQFCHFEYNGYMLLYPDYDIRRVDYSDSKLYRVIDRRTGAEFKFAVRSCAFAPGI